MADKRLTYRRRLPYNTKSNRTRVSKTPGGRLVYLYPKKPAKAPACGECKSKLRGLPIRRPKALRRLSKTSRRINRAYGGHLCSHCLRDRILRAFLTEEHKMVKKAFKQQELAAKAKK